MVKDKMGERRRYIRFDPEELEIALLSEQLEEFAGCDLQSFDFRPTSVGLIMEESFGGCSLVFLDKARDPKPLKSGSQVILKVGKLDPILAEIRWRQEVAPQVVQVGFKYVD